MEMIMAMAIGILAASGTWLILRPRTFQVIIGLALLSYAVNLFIFVSGSLNIAREPVLLRWLLPTSSSISWLLAGVQFSVALTDLLRLSGKPAWAEGLTLPSASR